VLATTIRLAVVEADEHPVVQTVALGATPSGHALPGSRRNPSEQGVGPVSSIHLPFIGTQYTALLGQGAFANNKQLRVSRTSTLADALISIDQYAFGEDAERKNRWRLRLTERLAHDAQRVRMLGSSAIDLAWTAEGRLDACIQLGNKPWDTSAGVLIAREAGARVLDHDGSEHSEQSRSTIAVTPALEVGLMEAVRATLVD
jgi:myo-inositol-1(or 4)-monophosphatase